MRSLLQACPLAFLLAAPAVTFDSGSGVHVPEDGIAIVEFESTAPTGDWVLENSDPGFAGTGYFRWNGPDFFNENQAGQGVLTYILEVLEGGTYQLRLHNRHENADATMENDVWVRMNGGPWLKLFSNGPGSVGNWTWESRFDLPSGLQPNASFDLDTGVNILEFSGRSFGFKMDRFHLYKQPNPLAFDIGADPTECVIGSRICDPNNPNSTGIPSRITVTGDTDISNQSLTLHAYDLPPGEFGFFLGGQMSGLVLNPGGSAGNLCLDGTIIRFINQIGNAGTEGTFTESIDVLNIPNPHSGPILAGQTWYFQAWHRDGLQSNFTNAICVPFN